MKDLYYTPPSDDIFEEVKTKAIELWTERYPEETSPFYAQEKINRIKNIKNVEDNIMFIFAMFDYSNQRLLAGKLTDEAGTAIRARMVAGGQPVDLIPFKVKGVYVEDDSEAPDFSGASDPDPEGR